jgi:hypothetical protein
VIEDLEQGAQEIVDYRFPDHLDIVGVRHSDKCWTIDVLDLDYRHYTFRLNLSDDDRWTIAPIAGFQYGEGLDLLGKDDGWQVSK